MTFDTLDYGTKATSTALETIEVEINSEIMIRDFAEAYSVELLRLNPTRADVISLASDDLGDYFEGLISIRVSMIQGTLKNWREVKSFAIPAWIQHVIAQVGIVISRDEGLRFVPKYDKVVDFKQMNIISDKLKAFESDGLSIHTDAFPRGSEGNEEVMGMAIVGDYIKSIKKDSHPASSYVSAFLGYKLTQGQNFAVLYRVRYDDVNFIASQLIHDKGLRL